MRFLLYFIIFIAARNVNSQTILPSFSAVHNKKSDWLPSDVSISAWIDASDSENYKRSGTLLETVTDKSGTYSSIKVKGDPTTNSFSPVNDYDNSLQTNQQLRLMRNRSSVECKGKFAEFFAVADIPGSGSTDISDIEKAEGYLAHKWGLEGNLPDDHPYKNTAPTN